MFSFGAGPVKGFALTLLDRRAHLGIHCRAGHPGADRVVVPGLPAQDPADRLGPARMWPLIRLLPQKTNFHFVAFARLAAALSIIAVVATVIGFFYPGLNMGIDFKGGTVLELDTGATPVDLAKVRGAVSGLNLGDVQVQRFGAPNDAVVRFQTPAGANAGDGRHQRESRAHQGLRARSRFHARTWWGRRFPASSSSRASRPCSPPSA